MIVNPLYIEETLNPGEYFTTSLNVLNNGNGPLGWEAEIIYPETDRRCRNGYRRTAGFHVQPDR